MKRLIIGLTLLTSMSSFAAGHGGLDTTLKCVPSDEGYALIKELSAISINRVSNVTNVYKSTKISESVIAENIGLQTCLDAVTDMEAKKIINH